MNHAPEKPKSLGGIVAIPPNVVLRDPGVQSEKRIHTSGLAEDVSRVAKLWGFDDHCFLYVEDVLIPKTDIFAAPGVRVGDKRTGRSQHAS